MGIHYIGEVNPGNLNRTFIDQITDGQLEWEPLNDIYDIVQIEYDEEKKRFVILLDLSQAALYLQRHYPLQLPLVHLPQSDI